MQPMQVTLLILVILSLLYASFRLVISIRFIVQKRGRVFSSVIGIISSMIIIGIGIMLILFRIF